MNRELCDKVYRRISEIPLIDIHTHLNPHRLRAENLSEIILYHYIATELITSGMPREILDIENPDERVRRSIPFLNKVKNTSTFWALEKIVTKLFGFSGDIGEDNFNVLKERFLDFEKHFDGISFLKERVRIQKSFLTLQFTDLDSPFDPLFTGSLRLEKLSKDFSLDSLNKLEELSSIEINNAERFREALKWIFEKFESKISSVAISLNPSEMVMIPDKATVDNAITKIRSDYQLTSEEKNHLISFTIREFLNLIKDSGIVFQLMLGVERPVIGASPPDYAIVLNDPRQLLSLCPVFHEYRNVKFDVISASRIQTHELNVIAKNYSNIFVSGFWWYSYYPSIINEKTIERLQILPINKWCAFFSDAYVPEWCFGKSELIKHQLSITLSDLIDQGYFTIDLALEVARKILYENPIEIYSLRV
ncbi:MAG: glucuronate isomerase [Thermoproteota archaeon]